MKKIYHIFFLKNLMTFLIPMLVPLLILGTLSSLLIQQNVKEQINQNNLNFLKQTKDNVELIFTELDSLHLQIVASAIQFVHLKNMLQKPLPDVNDFVELATLKNFIDSPAIARPYINSIYIYIDNDRERFITSSTGGLVSLDDYPDTSWYDSFRKHSSQEDIWSEKRTVPKTGSGDKQPIDVISMYRTLSVSAERDGVIALNVDPSYIEKRLAQLTTLENQSLLVIDKNNEVLFKNKSPQYLQHLDIAGIISNPNSLFSTELNHDSYVVTKLKSEKYGWSFRFHRAELIALSSTEPAAERNDLPVDLIVSRRDDSGLSLYQEKLEGYSNHHQNIGACGARALLAPASLQGHGCIQPYRQPYPEKFYRAKLPEDSNVRAKVQGSSHGVYGSAVPAEPAFPVQYS
ncbi:cache domain-containing protein [Paenibacillus sp. TAB 01]|uniref:cache domain-containing protein n=1 Tax=Paenibacillus sp. TAB 01 TaxID=3368988 RepID=UPI003750ADD4